jgi:kinesin family protein C1
LEEDDKVIELTQTSDNATSSKVISKSFPFSFDKVFKPSSDQALVFEEISQLVQSALDGYNVCIFAYGQTGSGKTFTMEGPEEFSSLDNDPLNSSQMGMIPRAVYQIFQSCKDLKEKGWTYTFQAMFLEVYNETIKDLLHDGEGKKIDVRHIGKVTEVIGATLVDVKSPDEVTKVLEKAKTNRSVAATNSNERSSRSHSVFILKISGINSVTQESADGVLNLIDLAGSERLSSSGSTGDRLKETQAINKSLSCVGDVIFALSQKSENSSQHIPYRNSKLTYLLQNSLGGNSKTLMFVNLSPRVEHFNESLCSLRFATKVNSCQIGTAKRAIK